MIDSDKIEFARILSGLAEIRSKPLSKEAMSMYWLALSDWSMDEFRQAAKHLLSHSQFMPTPYDFEQLRKEVSNETAGEAWEQVRSAIRHRHHSDATSINPKIDKIVRQMGGYTALGMTDSDQMTWREKRFFELWETESDAQEVRQALPLLANDRKADVQALLAGATKRIGKA